jgi:hypothetical protein
VHKIFFMFRNIAVIKSTCLDKRVGAKIERNSCLFTLFGQTIFPICDKNTSQKNPLPDFLVEVLREYENFRLASHIIG